MALLYIGKISRTHQALTSAFAESARSGITDGATSMAERLNRMTSVAEGKGRASDDDMRHRPFTQTIP